MRDCRAHAVKRPLETGFLIDSGRTVAEKEYMLRIWPNMPWLSVRLIHEREYIWRTMFRMTVHTAIDKATKRRKYSNSQYSRIRNQTLRSGRPDERSSSVREGWTPSCGSNHVEIDLSVQGVTQCIWQG